MTCAGPGWVTVPSPEPRIHPFTQDRTNLGLFWVSQDFSGSDAQQGQPLLCCSIAAPANPASASTGAQTSRPWLWLRSWSVHRGSGGPPPLSCDALTHPHLEPALLAQAVLFGLKGWVLNILMVPIREVSEMPYRSEKKTLLKVNSIKNTPENHSQKGKMSSFLTIFTFRHFTG